MNNNLKGILHGVIPAFLLASSVGQIYAFTNFAIPISEVSTHSMGAIQFAFSLGIFFLGMGAAFFGKIVEKNIRMSSIIGTILFFLGFYVTSMSVRMDSLIGLYLGYGVLIGLATGIIYITPVKTMMLWYPKYKGLASALSIVFFGLGSTISTMIYYNFLKEHSISNVMIIFSVLYAMIMSIGILLLKKPVSENIAALGDEFKYSKLLTDKFFIHSWLFMFLNISAGLCLIPLSTAIMSRYTEYTVQMLVWIIGLAGIFNGAGRLVFAYASDIIKERINIIIYILGISLAAVIIGGVVPTLIGLTILLINACYGAGFSVIPAILSNKYGMNNISKIHGAVLSAWGFAGLFGNQISIKVMENNGYIGLIILLIIMYLLNLINFVFMKLNLNRTVKRCH